MSTEFLYPFNKSSMSELYASAAALAKQSTQNLGAETPTKSETSNQDDESLATADSKSGDFVQHSEEEETAKNSIVNEDSQFGLIQHDLQAFANGDHVKRPMNAFVGHSLIL